MKEKIMLFFIFGGIYFIFSSFVYFFSDIFIGVLHLVLPAVITIMIVLILFNKAKWLENIRRKYLNLSQLLMILGIYFYCMLVQERLGSIFQGEFAGDFFAITEIMIVFVFYLALLFWLLRLIIKTVRKTT